MSRPRIQHISIPCPPGSADQARAFDRILPGTEELSPLSIRTLDLAWDRPAKIALHLFIESPLPDTSGYHVSRLF